MKGDGQHVKVTGFQEYVTEAYGGVRGIYRRTSELGIGWTFSEYFQDPFLTPFAERKRGLDTCHRKLGGT